MAQHFLLSAQARTLSLMKIAMMRNEEVHELFKQIRWSNTNGNPVCPHCGSTKRPYSITTREQFRCKECFHTFSVTSGTLFASHKLPLKTYLMAIAIFTNSVKSLSALQLSRDLDIQYKSAWVLSHKIRESLIEDTNNDMLTGVCEIDGVYVGGKTRQANTISDRVDRRTINHPNKRVVISLRQRADIGDEPIGAIRTKTFVLKSENTFDIANIVNNHVTRGSELHADEAVAYDDLHARFDMKRVNHQIEYRGRNGENNNQSESYNARFRRMEYGQCHHLSPLYLSNYANEIAYREDTRRKSNGAIANDILTRCLSKSISNEFCGYWQGNKRVAERLGA
jgi:transposase-like protein